MLSSDLTDSLSRRALLGGAFAQMVLVAGTVTFFSYSWTTDILHALTGEKRPAGSSSGGSSTENEPVDLSGLDALFEKAAASEPGWQSIRLSLPNASDGPGTFALDRGNRTRPDLRSALILDRTGEVVGSQTYADNTAARNARLWIRWIHTGEAGGWLGQTLAGVAALAGCVLVYTGWMLAWRRFQAWRARDATE